MPGPDRAVAAVRHSIATELRERGLTGARVLVAVSGGTDSLALAAGAAHAVPALGGTVGAVIVDHGLQAGSELVADRAGGQCRSLGLNPVLIRAVQVQRSGGEGVEAAARHARLQAVQEVAVEQDAAAVLLGHTQDDQAEQVLLGLARGSGARSLAGMPRGRRLIEEPELWLLRPLLGLPRTTTAAACAALGLQAWHDPHNSDPGFARVRARAAVQQLEAALGPGVSASLARTADLLRDDADALEAAAEDVLRRLGEPPWSVAEWSDVPAAVRRRCWRASALRWGAPGAALASVHLHQVDALLTRWHGQGPVHLPGGVRARRQGDRMWLERAADS